MHFNIVDIVTGGLLVVTAVVFLKHFRKQPDSPKNRRLRVLSIIMMILGWIVMMWEPLFALVSRQR